MLRELVEVLGVFMTHDVDKLWGPRLESGNLPPEALVDGAAGEGAMKGMRPLVGLTVAAGLLLVGAATMVDAQGKPLTIRLGVHSSIVGAADVIAVRQGYFKQEGLEVEARRFALGKEGRDAMIAGAIDINATAPTPFLIGLDKKIPFSAVAVNSDR